MTTILLIIIYIAFISLGLPDSLFGASWPAIYGEMTLPFSYGSFATVVCSAATTISSLVSARMINKFGTSKVTAFSTAMTAIALLGYSFSGNFWLLCLLSIPLGFGAGTIDTALNNYVALHYSAMQMSFLHCFYGIGVSISPYLLSLVINTEAGWRGGYRITSLIQATIAIMLFATLWIWKRVNNSSGANSVAGADVDAETDTVSASEADTDSDANETEPKTLSFKETIKIPGVKLMCFIFFLACSIECVCGIWGSTFLVEYKHLAAAEAAKMVTLFYVGLMLGRFFSGVLAAKLSAWRIVWIGMGVLLCAVVILLLPGSAYLAAAGLFLAGLGVGPLFPNFTYLTPQFFGADVSQSVLGTEYSFAYIGIMISPPLCGVLGQYFSMGIFPIFNLILVVACVCGILRLKAVLKIER